MLALGTDIVRESGYIISWGFPGAWRFLIGGKISNCTPHCPALPHSLERALWRERAFSQYRGIYATQKVLSGSHPLSLAVLSTDGAGC